MTKLFDIITSPTFWLGLTGIAIELGTYLQTFPLSTEVSHILAGILFAAVAIRRAMKAPQTTVEG